MVQFTPEEIQEYRAKQTAKLSEVQKEQAQIDAEAHKAKRDELEATLKVRFLAAGGKDSEWLKVKSQVVIDALIRATLSPIEEDEPKPLAPAPMAKSKYRN